MSDETSAVQSGEPVDPARLRVEGDGEQAQVTHHDAEQLRAFRAHAGVFVVGMAVIFGVNLVTNLAAGIAGSWSAWWSLWALIGWGAGVAIHGLVVWLNRPALPAGEASGGQS